jgi:hypothetical protein
MVDTIGQDKHASRHCKAPGRHGLDRRGEAVLRHPARRFDRVPGDLVDNDPSRGEAAFRVFRATGAERERGGRVERLRQGLVGRGRVARATVAVGQRNGDGSEGVDRADGPGGAAAVDRPAGGGTGSGRVRPETERCFRGRSPRSAAAGERVARRIRSGSQPASGTLSRREPDSGGRWFQPSPRTCKSGSPPPEPGQAAGEAPLAQPPGARGRAGESGPGRRPVAPTEAGSTDRGGEDVGLPHRLVRICLRVRRVEPSLTHPRGDQDGLVNRWRRLHALPPGEGGKGGSLNGGGKRMDVKSSCQ